MCQGRSAPAGRDRDKFAGEHSPGRGGRNGCHHSSRFDVSSRLSGGELQLLIGTTLPRHQVGLAYLTNRYRSLAAEEFARLCQITAK